MPTSKIGTLHHTPYLSRGEKGGPLFFHAVSALLVFSMMQLLQQQHVILRSIKIVLRKLPIIFVVSRVTNSTSNTIQIDVLYLEENM